MRTRLITLAVLALTVLAVCAAPALAEGYNKGSVITTGFGTNQGLYVQSAEGNQIQSNQGPHGNYATTTNKCQDCHSTHYASGAYMLLRANSRTAACDYCHTGGGGSDHNIMMDNDYNDTADVVAGAASAEASTSYTLRNGGAEGMGYGTGHTLGYAGKAPADVDPAFQEEDGLACFNCHTPHGNSARVMATFGSPGTPAGKGDVDGLNRVWYAFPAQASFGPLAWIWFGTDFGDANGFAAMYGPAPAGASAAGLNAGEKGMFVKGMMVPMMTTTDAAYQGNIGAAPVYYNQMQPDGSAGTMSFPYDIRFPSMDDTVTATMEAYNLLNWGSDVQKGNIVVDFSFTPFNAFAGFGIGDSNSFTGDAQRERIEEGANPNNPAEYGVEVWKKPLFGTGKFLLLKNPDNENNLGLASDAAIGPGTGNKIKTDWTNPLGPAATWGDFFSTGNDEKFPIAFPFGIQSVDQYGQPSYGVAMENEFCTDCHDGAAGQSTQAARVFKPGTPGDGYVTAYSHDSQPRGCARQQYLNPNDGNNFGPHCRNCHTGAASCEQCHGDYDQADPTQASNQNYGQDWGWGYEPRLWASTTATTFVEAKSSYQPNAYVKASAYYQLNGQCVDGGFSYPHRTLGANMLKDKLYGVDFDGSPIEPGTVRNSNSLPNKPASYFDTSWQPTTGPQGDKSIDGQAAENLDSVCIDCHGNATYYNGDNPDKYYTEKTQANPLGLLPGQVASWDVAGWELLLKGLP